MVELVKDLNAIWGNFWSAFKGQRIAGLRIWFE